ncbi:hypothetical protein TWF569_002232 [Orbilia oligospora]|uniref:Uncharacterized protein n=1 Tax=Orbilia oligospora TaxID=2813651 RepID=A0A7C8J6E8_ORBOL|nr:hypothetical protein TWF103_003408 [Orbilia oligospora]KAF3087170.1 hypothetical protein TWF706_011246 [Orbilia oligospora]KAF3092136.1 hypothetical protein TWF102_008545 [Orbilia oligospora]KAF3122276.1 hypothetical protein TWF569_002232 [Orbilia oligospora]KAF3128916.1 hypothetical protein TWF594_011243 [Orbilia oligospora]
METHDEPEKHLLRRFFALHDIPKLSFWGYAEPIVGRVGGVPNEKQHLALRAGSAKQPYQTGFSQGPGGMLARISIQCEGKG